jgi:hypothetical protein
LPFAITLTLDPEASASIERMWRAIANAGIDSGSLRLG